MLLIRHARAGERTEWSGDDRRRPLDERGRKQAIDLVAALSHYQLTRIMASPFDRCVQTVEPLAQARGLEVEIRDELGEEQQFEQGVELVRSLLDEDIAVCGHGGSATNWPA
jgi:8-oxo-dGTP diphosphatase